VRGGASSDVASRGVPTGGGGSGLADGAGGLADGAGGLAMARAASPTAR